MPKIVEVCNQVRSKNAGPFWITIDLRFPDDASFQRYHLAPALQPDAIAALYGVDAKLIKYFSLPTLRVVKISYPRLCPQGGTIERDMHGGQQYVRLLDVELEAQ
jgi:Domain of unknown function (DUF4387)